MKLELVGWTSAEPEIFSNVFTCGEKSGYLILSVLIKVIAQHKASYNEPLSVHELLVGPN